MDKVNEMAMRRFQVGDAFLRCGLVDKPWIVERIFEYDGLPLHVRLVEPTSCRVITLSELALDDERQFKFVRQMSEEAGTVE